MTAEEIVALKAKLTHIGSRPFKGAAVDSALGALALIGAMEEEITRLRPHPDQVQDAYALAWSDQGIVEARVREGCARALDDAADRLQTAFADRGLHFRHAAEYLRSLGPTLPRQHPDDLAADNASLRSALEELYRRETSPASRELIDEALRR